MLCVVAFLCVREGVVFGGIFRAGKQSNIVGSAAAAATATAAAADTAAAVVTAAG